MYLFKRVTDDMSGLRLSKQVARMIQKLSSMIALLIVSWILKETRVELLPHLALKAPLTMTISMYYMIRQSATYTDT